MLLIAGIKKSFEMPEFTDTKRFYEFDNIFILPVIVAVGNVLSAVILYIIARQWNARKKKLRETKAAQSM